MSLSKQGGMGDRLAEKGIDLSLQRSGVQVGEIVDIKSTPEEDLKVLKKIDRFILPLMGFCYMLQYMDKVSLGYSTQLGLTKDLVLVGVEYSWASAVFYFGYLVFSWPSSYLSVRFPIAKYLACTVTIWGVVLMTHGATKDFAGLMCARFFLGVCEAAVAPGFSLITGMFYKRREQPSRMGVWFAGNCIANMISGVVAYGIGHISSPLATWRCLFLILGGITAAYGIILLIFLPNSPASSKFLTKEERHIAVHRTLENKTGVLDEGKFKTYQMIEALKDPQAWLLFCYTLSVNIPNGGVTSFSSLIVAGFGFSPLNALLVQMPLGATQLAGLIFACLLSTYVRNTRLIAMITLLIISLIGNVMVYKISNDNPWGRLVGIWLLSPFGANIPISLSIIVSNVGGFTKKATVSAMLFIGYCVGNIIGPQFFFTSESPAYPTGIRAMLVGFCLGGFFLVTLLCYYIFENRRRDRLYGSPSLETEAEELADELSNKTDRELPSFRYIY